MCMGSMVVLIEITYNLDTESFIQALRRVIDRIENVKILFSDNDPILLAVKMN